MTWLIREPWLVIAWVQSLPLTSCTPSGLKRRVIVHLVHHWLEFPSFLLLFLSFFLFFFFFTSLSSTKITTKFNQEMYAKMGAKRTSLFPSSGRGWCVSWRRGLSSLRLPSSLRWQGLLPRPPRWKRLPYSQRGSSWQIREKRRPTHTRPAFRTMPAWH